MARWDSAKRSEPEALTEFQRSTEGRKMLTLLEITNVSNQIKDLAIRCSELAIKLQDENLPEKERDEMTAEMNKAGLELQERSQERLRLLAALHEVGSIEM